MKLSCKFYLVFWTDRGKLRLQSVDKTSGVNLHILAAGLERPSGVVTLDLEQQPFRKLYRICKSYQLQETVIS